MNKLLLLLKTKARMIANRFIFIERADAWKIGGLSAIGILFLIGLYSGFYRLLKYLQDVPVIGPLLILKILSMIFLTFFAMLIFSNLITAFSTFYFARDLEFHISRPTPFRTVFIYKYLESIVYSSWMIFLTFLPFILAFAKVKKLGLSFFISLFFSIIPFIGIAGAIGILICVILMRLFPTPKTRDVILILGIFGSGVLYIVLRMLQPAKIVSPKAWMSVFEYITALKTPTAEYLPSYWFVLTIQSFIGEYWVTYWTYLGLLIIICLILTLITFTIANKHYYPGWVEAQEGISQKLQDKKIWKFLENLFYSVSRPIRAIVIKDIKVFFRDSNLWSQMLILLALIVVYIFNIYKLPLDTIYLKSLVSFLNIGLAGFVLGGLSLRFVFPAVSLERECFWIVRSSKIKVKPFLWEKFWLSLFPLLILGGILIYTSNILLKADWFVMLLSTGTLFLITCGLTGMGVGMGAIFPKFKVENVAQIESSSGGILYMFFSLFYIGLVLAFEAWPMKMYFQMRMGDPNAFNILITIWAFSAVIVLTFLAISLPMTIGTTSLENYE